MELDDVPGIVRTLVAEVDRNRIRAAVSINELARFLASPVISHNGWLAWVSM